MCWEEKSKLCMVTKIKNLFKIWNVLIVKKLFLDIRQLPTPFNVTEVQLSVESAIKLCIKIKRKNISRNGEILR